MGGYKKWALSDVLTAADLNAYCSFQSVMVFATTAARDAAITGANKLDGMVCYVASGDASEGLYTYNGSSWTKGPGWNAPWGVRTAKTDAVDRVRTTTMAENGTSLRSSETYIANRYLRFTVLASLSETSAGTGCVVEVYNNTTSTSVGRVAQLETGVGSGYQVSGCFVAVSTAGAQYTVRMQGVTHNVNVLGATIQPTKFIIEDIGPSGNPV
jgi:hypothetical protein